MSTSFKFNTDKVVINNHFVTNVLFPEPVVATVVDESGSESDSDSEMSTSVNIQWYFTNDKKEWQSMSAEINATIEDGYQGFLDVVNVNLKNAELNKAEAREEPDVVTYSRGGNNYEVHFGSALPYEQSAEDFHQVNCRTGVTRSLLRVEN
jgi:hypothetical protein